MSERLNELNAVLPALSAWPSISVEIERRIGDLTERLIAQDSEQTRGAIKELRYLIDLPAVLQVERDHLAAGLSDSSDPAQ